MTASSTYKNRNPGVAVKMSGAVPLQFHIVECSALWLLEHDHLVQ